MKTRYEQMTSGGIDGYSNFIGDDSDYRDWFGLLGRSRDSGCLENSNFNTAVKMLDVDKDNYRIESYSHWAVGWIEEIYVKPGTKAYDIAVEIENSLSDYPVLDDEDFCEREHADALEIWQNCYDVEERIEYIRNHRNQFEFRNYSDLRQCIKGEHFCGYESELIG